ncbi:MAG: hypothetical protein A3A83_02715 [Candidatus Doudnabacteria bacterium RIFCSPLOWO2_01_FULL_48_57]|uniref:Histidyl-tRNA synthetase n=1 Tax=Candidatus Doudnabacteria bacterium RIFCSPLOWO2_02_FULL_48_13 TaxID=1817845 RepID=A0A1F5QA58_9BACT|nr:MAG: hypothetical protein A2668_03680 [Candidatus Doudnabacteria bacterium RIFCSPHIGHO2_01_FULL_48_180]OGE91356.1 MAG: hypothetical protein A3F44_03595 [Candidatus Doudnabacteria bacterium RIFCSPHIGHO2_12_FULL_47_25]OGE96689.1 MAG: hypothetical protein A3A83_02715 [Candidatus Doudnabacteria bacterium RIFCSPLOWO2_01_FULL_48_57]OGE99053.1 MAG: hypothetical protein A3J05_04735 [Candidatus Doudnabacteria bacterium RIFCSPLOWO2_02_FULL_48_13]
MINMQKKKKASETQTLPITVIPPELQQPDVFLDNLHRVVGNFGFHQVLLPALEERKIFTKQRDLEKIYGDNLLEIAGAPGDSVLSPVHTFSVLRRYLQNVKTRGPHVSKWFSLSPIINIENNKPVTAHEFALYILGEDSSLAGAQLVNTTAEILREFGVSEFMIELNSLGCGICQKNYQELLESHVVKVAGRLCRDCEADLPSNPTALWRCDNSNCQEIVAGAPQIIDSLDVPCKTNLMGVLENIDDLGIPYTLNPTLSLPLHQEKVVFRITAPDAPENVIGHGGNYSAWTKALGFSEPIPVMGFITTFDKLWASVPEERRRTGPKIDVFMVPLGPIAVRKAMVLHRDLQHSGISSAEGMLSSSSIKNQLKEAVEKKCEIALIIGQKEAIDETVILRDMRSGMQELFAMDRIIEEVKKRLGK